MEATFGWLGSLCTEHIRSVNLGMDGQSELLLCTLSVLHIKSQMEATFGRLGFLCTAHIMSVNLGIDGQTECLLCTLSILPI